jgi:RNA polymerase sigma-70 factor (ECF subfamily)
MPNQEDASDDEMMHQIQQGNQRAFRQLVKQYLNPLYRFAHHLLGDQMTAEDIVQDTFIKVWYQAKQWQPGKAKLSTWLHTIVRHQCIDSYRKENHHTVSLEEVEDIAVAESADNIHQLELAEQITQALQQLPERQRTAVLLCYYQGFSNQEAAELLSISIEAVESLLTRGRKTLKRKLLPN